MKYFLLLNLCLIASLQVFSGNSSDSTSSSMIALKDSSYLRKKDMQRQADYEQFKYAFAPRKKNMWSLGIQGGATFLSADVANKYGYGGGITLQKALGHVFAIRLQAQVHQVIGQDWRVSLPIPTYRNFNMVAGDLSVQGMVYWNNISFYRRSPKVLVYSFAGIGVSAYRSRKNITDANGNAYDYTSVQKADNYFDQFRVKSDISALQDETYETEANTGDYDLRVKNYNIGPSVSGGLGLLFKLSRRVDFSIEERISWHNTDDLDAERNTRRNERSGLDDIVAATQIGFHFKLGKREEPLYWVNPLKRPYDDMMALKSNLYKGEFLKDEDEDGVIDLMDKDLNTPPNTIVTTLGESIDIDRDGYPDRIDMEPFSPKGSMVSKQGVALDNDDDGVADIFDRQLNSPNGSLVDAKGIDISTMAKDAPQSTNVAVFDPVFFDLNKAEVKSEFYPSIYKVAVFMQNNTQTKMLVKGHTDNRANDDYNVKLAKKRAQSVVDILTSAFNISADRFEISALGKAEPLIPGLPDKGHDPNVEGGHYLNRRVTFEAK